MTKEANKCKVIYRGDGGGLHTYEGTKIVFQHRENESELKEGLGVQEQGTYKDLGTYAFADFENIKTVEPEDYRTLDFYSWKGVPARVYKGTYGDSVIFKEEYAHTTYIRAYSEEGVAMLYERAEVNKRDYKGENMYYTRLDKEITDWKEITEEVKGALYKEVESRETKVDLGNRDVAYCLEKIHTNGVKRLKNGIIVGEGKYENMVLWVNHEGKVGTTWIGNIEGLEDMEYEDITAEVTAKVHEYRKEGI